MKEEKFQLVKRVRRSKGQGRFLKKRWLWCAYSALSLSFVSMSSLAQDAETDAPPASTPENAISNTTPETTAGPAATRSATVSQTERLDRLEKMAEAAQQENEALKAQLDSQDQRIQALAEENESLAAIQEDADLAEMEDLQNKDLQIYGFADVQWYKFILTGDSWYKGFWNENNSFTVGHWNTYFEKRVSDHFRFLGEVRFLFQPYGHEIAFEKTNATTGEVTQFERVKTGAIDWVDGYAFNWGGIAIQRLWMEYKYNDYIGIRVGNFLTPWGIWNVDHASSVVIPGHRPYIITAQLIPESQTGALLFGSIYPSDTITLEYAFSVSNGRGPTSKIYDLDETKAMGLRLAFQYDGPVSIGFGTYLYMGEYADSKRVETFDERYEYNVELTEKYKEKIMAFHLKFQVGDLLLQGEYARGLIQYDEDARYLFYEANSWRPTTYLADYVQQGLYGMMAYRLPFKSINLSPYLIYEYQEPRDLSTLPTGHNYGGGLNWRITPDVVWKVDYVYHRANSERWNIPASRLHFGVISTQLAVNF